MSPKDFLALKSFNLEDIPEKNEFEKNLNNINPSTKKRKNSKKDDLILDSKKVWNTLLEIYDKSDKEIAAVASRMIGTKQLINDFHSFEKDKPNFQRTPLVNGIIRIYRIWLKKGYK